MRKWVPVGLIVLAIAWYILTNVGYTMAVNDIAADPITRLDRDGVSVPVQQSGVAPQPDEAKGLGGQGIMFGIELTFALPDGAIVTCRQRFAQRSCDGGWKPQRGP